MNNPSSFATLHQVNTIEKYVWLSDVILEQVVVRVASPRTVLRVESFPLIDEYNSDHGLNNRLAGSSRCAYTTATPQPVAARQRIQLPDRHDVFTLALSPQTK